MILSMSTNVIESMNVDNINFDIFCTALVSCKLRKAKKRACRDSSFFMLLVAACDANSRSLAVCYSV